MYAGLKYSALHTADNVTAVDLATQSGWDHEDARKKFAEGYVCLTCYRTVEKYSNTDTDNVQSPSLAPRHLLTLSDLAVISLL